MATTTAFSSASALRCSRCHFALLNAFTSLAGVSIRPALKPHAFKLFHRQPIQRQALNTCSFRLSEFVQQNEQDSVLVESEEPPENEQILGSESNTEPASSVPWYLQIDAPQRSLNPLSERQRLPELPTDPPPLLQPMLEYISIDLGLDDLSILDLRKLDPPPALGTNLLMVFGTTRSERHLHVSADRFCRWLRTNHKLSPYADGLLGRGELKLKMRRKARRARLLSSVGSSESSNVDDGLRTGWVCVNLGTIEDGAPAVEEVLEPEGFVGFGGQVSGAKVVIQMLTEEKREELDLEHLWGGVLARQERKEARRKSEDESLSGQDSQQGGVASLGHKIQNEEQEFLEQGVGRNASSLKDHESDSSYYSPTSPRKPSSFHYHQVRGFHSHPNSYTRETNNQENIEYVGVDSLSAEPNIKLPHENPGNRLLSHSPAYQHQLKDKIQEFDDTAKLISLRTLLIYLESLPRAEAFEKLGTGIEDCSTTSFLQSFYQNFPMFPDIRFWECRLSLMCYALKLRHRDYFKSDLWRLYGEMKACIIDIPSDIFVMVFKTLLRKRRGNKQKRGLSQTSIENAVQVLEDMHFRGHDIMVEDLRLELLVTSILATQYFYDPKVPNVPRFNSNALSRLKEVLNQHTFGSSGDFVKVDSHIRILRAYADAKNWGGFWRHWHGIAGSMQRRPKELYLLMFHRIADTRHQASCAKTLREWVPQMRREEPAIELDADLAKVVVECMQVAEPEIALEASEGQNESGEWVRLWRRCELQLNPPSRDLRLP